MGVSGCGCFWLHPVCLLVDEQGVEALLDDVDTPLARLVWHGERHRSGAVDDVDGELGSVSRALRCGAVVGADEGVAQASEVVDRVHAPAVRCFGDPEEGFLRCLRAEGDGVDVDGHVAGASGLGDDAVDIDVCLAVGEQDETSLLTGSGFFEDIEAGADAVGDIGGASADTCLEGVDALDELRRIGFGGEGDGEARVVETDEGDDVGAVALVGTGSVSVVRPAAGLVACGPAGDLALRHGDDGRRNGGRGEELGEEVDKHGGVSVLVKVADGPFHRSDIHLMAPCSAQSAETSDLFRSGPVRLVSAASKETAPAGAGARDWWDGIVERVR